jgi:hypothetical protein
VHLLQGEKTREEKLIRGVSVPFTQLEFMYAQLAGDVPVIQCVEHTVVANERLETEPEFGVALDPASRDDASASSTAYLRSTGCTHLIAYPPQLAPAATARAGSASGYAASNAFQPARRSVNGAPPQSSAIASVSAWPNVVEPVGFGANTM